MHGIFELGFSLGNLLRFWPAFLTEMTVIVLIALETRRNPPTLAAYARRPTVLAKISFGTSACYRPCGGLDQVSMFEGHWWICGDPFSRTVMKSMSAWRRATSARLRGFDRISEALRPPGASVLRLLGGQRCYVGPRFRPPPVSLTRSSLAPPVSDTGSFDWPRRGSENHERNGDSPQMAATKEGATARRNPIAAPDPLARFQIALSCDDERRPPSPTTIDAAIEIFAREGLCILAGALPTDLIQRCRERALVCLQECIERARALGKNGIQIGIDHGYAEIVQRAEGRFDMLHGLDSAPFNDPRIDSDPPWMPIVRALLDDEDLYRLYHGILVTQPRGIEQVWHADGEHLFPGREPQLPVHCLNVFVPLVDLSRHNGGTELCPGSHRLTCHLPRIFQQDPDLLSRIDYRGEPIVPLLKAGTVLLFDYRLAHRGLENKGDTHRPILYQTFAAPWFQDVRNFPDRRLFGAGEPSGDTQTSPT